MKPSSTTPVLQDLQQGETAATHRDAPTIAPQRAVQDYLNALLQDATSLARVEDMPVPTALPRVAPAPGLAPEPVVAPVPEAIPALEPELKSELKSKLQPKSDGAWHDGRPAWAQQRFECLLFKVAGLTLAVPLVELGGVLEIEEELRPLFGQPDWFLGLLPSKTAGTVKAIDTARWVMPEKYPEDACKLFKYLILVGSSEWGLACHSVEEAITLEPHQVRWRNDRSRRPWLAGTVVEHMCAILDVSALLELLEQHRLKSVPRK
jgi:purine-binding chemotaxis protein CheW